MSLGSLLLAVWLILVGLTWAGVIAIGPVFLGWWAVVTGALLIIEQYRPIYTLPAARR